MPFLSHALGTVAACLTAAGAAAAESDRPTTAAVVEVEPAAALPPCCTAPGRFAHLAATSAKAARIDVEPIDRGFVVLIDGRRFAEYRTDVANQPVIWPIIGPSGHEMTRSYPLGPAQPGEREDHPHHESLWFAHGGVNGHDFWHASDRTSIEQRGSARLEVPGVGPALVTTNEWIANGEIQLSDVRTVAFGTLSSDTDSAPRFIDYTIELHASHGPITFGDTKEGTFGIRIPGPMKIDAGFGGSAFNSNDEHDGAAWGQPASWVAYQGSLKVPGEEDTPEGGIIIMSHPDSRPCRWHVRGYGLFAANPFGVQDFPNDGTETGGYRLEDGESLILRYRAVFHAGRVGTPIIDSWYDRFAETARTADHHEPTSP